MLILSTVLYWRLPTFFAELPDAAVKTLMRYVSIALSRYADNTSRYALRKAIIAISIGQSSSGKMEKIYRSSTSYYLCKLVSELCMELDVWYLLLKL